MVGTTPPFASFFGFRSRTLTFFGVSFICAILIYFTIYLAIVLGGTAAPYTRRVWGRSLFDPQSDHQI